MQSIDLTDLEKFDNELASLLKEVPERRRVLHERIARVIEDEVKVQIDNSGIKDSSGKIKDWQERHVGSQGGYAAVRAQSSSVGKKSPGAITNYLESGHKIRTPSGKGKYYRPRIKKPYVDGFHFYSTAKNKVESRALAEAEAYVKEITDILEG